MKHICEKALFLGVLFLLCSHIWNLMAEAKLAKIEKIVAVQNALRLSQWECARFKGANGGPDKRDADWLCVFRNPEATIRSNVAHPGMMAMGDSEGPGDSWRDPLTKPPITRSH